MKIRFLLMLVLAGALATGAAADEAANRLAEARKIVDASDRYLHHSGLKRGMHGHGLTVLAGTEIVRFDVTILSVLKGSEPHRDMILARLAGPGQESFLDVSGIIAGMSGSPVYMTDPTDGKSKLIGAVAYGWFAQKTPICGIQPITQMIAASDLVGPKDDPEAGAATPEVHQRGLGLTAEQFRTLLRARVKADVVAEAWQIARNSRPRAALADRRLARLDVPLSVPTASDSAIESLQQLLAPAGLRPVQAAAAAKAPEEAKAKLEPGGAIAVNLVTGDMDFAAVGTVTDVVDDTVLAFGHSFMAEGPSDLPMGPAYVHTVISTFRSFKLASPISTTGALQRDEQTAVVGKVGAVSQTVPMKIHLNLIPAGRKQTLEFQVVRDRRYLPLLMRALVDMAFYAWSDPPEQHHVSYRIDVEYEQLGRMEIRNVFSGAGAGPVASDLGLLLFSLVDNPVAAPRFPSRVEVEITLQEGTRQVRLEQVTLDSRIVKPGGRLSGRARFRPFRDEPFDKPFSFQLPDDIQPGQYELRIGDYMLQLDALSDAMPNRFDPRSAEGIFQTVRTITQPRIDQLYLVVQSQDSSLAIRQDVLNDLPPSRLEMLRQANPPRSRAARNFWGRSIPVEFHVAGQQAVEFTVQRQPSEMLLAPERNDP